MTSTTSPRWRTTRRTAWARASGRNDISAVHRLVPKIKAGTVWVNCHNFVDPDHAVRRLQAVRLRPRARPRRDRSLHRAEIGLHRRTETSAMAGTDLRVGPVLRDKGVYATFRAGGVEPRCLRLGRVAGGLWIQHRADPQATPPAAPAPKGRRGRCRSAGCCGQRRGRTG